MIEIYKHENYCVLKISKSEANLELAESLKNAVAATIEKGHIFMIVDFKLVDYVDSTFLAALVSALKEAMKHKGDIAVARLNKHIEHLFRLVRMDKVLMIFPDLPESFTGSFGRNSGDQS